MIRLARQLLLDAADDVMRHEGLSVVLTDMAVDIHTGFASREAVKLSGEVVFHDDRALGALDRVDEHVFVERNDPGEMHVVGADALVAELLTSLLDHAVSGTKADQRNVGVRGPVDLGRRDLIDDADHLSGALFQPFGGACGDW